jgi:hypothetical protein
MVADSAGGINRYIGTEITARKLVAFIESHDKHIESNANPPPTRPYIHGVLDFACSL